MNSGNATSRSGIILFEVILATAIFCLVGIALSNGLGDAAASIRRANRENQVRLGLESRLAEAKVGPIEESVHREEPSADGVTYEREWKVVQIMNRDKTVLPGLYLLTVRARWIDRGHTDSEEASLRLYRPQS